MLEIHVAVASEGSRAIFPPALETSTLAARHSCLIVEGAFPAEA